MGIMHHMKKTTAKSPKKSVVAANKGHQWNLELFYKNSKDPQIEKDVAEVERLYAEFAKKYDTKNKKYLTDAKALLSALTDYENLAKKATIRPIMYFTFASHMDSRNTEATAQISLISSRFTKAA